MYLFHVGTSDGGVFHIFRVSSFRTFAEMSKRAHRPIMTEMFCARQNLRHPFQCVYVTFRILYNSACGIRSSETTDRLRENPNRLSSSLPQRKPNPTPDALWKNICSSRTTGSKFCSFSMRASFADTIFESDDICL